MSNETNTERPYRERTPWLDRFVSRQVGKALVWLARRAHARGDRHEFNHIRAAVDAGNSAPCERDGRCQLGAIPKGS